MDPNALVMEISSDEEFNIFDRGITDSGEDHNWIAELLDEVNKANYDEDGGGRDSDEVVVTGEVLPSKKSRKKSKSKSPTSVGSDDDCVILDNDPDKPVEIRNDQPSNDNEDDDSDELRVVGEKGQVACRDYPHPRHLCIKFPFSDTPNQNHCNQCYCYVCDSLAPCLYWGDGSLSANHCHATDKDEFWRLERKNAKNGTKLVPKSANTPLLDHLPPPNVVRPPAMAHNQCMRSSLPPGFGVPGITNQTRSPVYLPRNKYQPSLVSRTRDGVHHNSNLSNQVHRTVFKRPGSAGVAPMSNRYLYGSYRSNFGIRNPSYGMLPGPNQYLGQSNFINIPVPHPSQNLTRSTFANAPVLHPSQNLTHLAFSNTPVPPPSQNLTRSVVNSLPHQPLHFQPQFSGRSNPNTAFDFSPSFQSQPNFDPYPESPSCFQPQETSHAQPSYTVRPQENPSISISDYSQDLTHQENQSQSTTLSPSVTNSGLCLPPSETTQQTNIEAAAPTNEPSLAGLVDYQYDNWMLGDQVVDAGSMDIPGAYGFNEFSPDLAFIDTGPIFDL